MYNTGIELRGAEIITVTEAGKEMVANLPAAIAVHTAAGATTGAFNTIVSGGDLGQNMFTGALSAGMAKGLGHYIPDDIAGNAYADFGIGLTGHAAIGGISGGITAQMYGGTFGQGFEQGAMAGAYGYVFNAGGNRLKGWWNNTALPWIKKYYSEHRSQQEIQTRDYTEHMSRGLKDATTLYACGKAGACYVAPFVATAGATIGTLNPTVGVVAGLTTGVLTVPVGNVFWRECTEGFKKK